MPHTSYYGGVTLRLKRRSHLSEVPKSPLPTHSGQWVPITIAEIRVYIDINIYFSLYSLTVRDDYWRIHKIGEFMGLKRFE
jgi:hypothetical protein